MNILVVGSGGREHALVRKIKESRLTKNLYACPGNGGIAADARCVDIKANDIDGVLCFAKNNSIDLVVVAPDDPLVAGMVDALEQEGIKTFGPNKAAAIIEGSKVFSKNLMKKYDIPTAAYEIFNSAEKAVEYIKTMPNAPMVVKADGLALGKGVIIADGHNDAIEAVKSMLEDKTFGESGCTVVIEEFLEGIEVSVLCFTDAKTIVPMVSSMDHKRIFDDDKGPNTGGMGTIAPHPMFTKELAEQAMEKIFIPTINAMNKEGRPFKGCLYFGLILTKKGPYVIEYNCRFGDPEAQVVLPLLDSDLVEIMLAIHAGKLNQTEVKWKDHSAACVIIASGGYPGNYEKGLVISGLNDKGQLGDAIIFHAGTALNDGKYITTGGRVLGVSATGATLRQAIDNSYKAVKEISFKGSIYRKDIGAKVLGIK